MPPQRRPLSRIVRSMAIGKLSWNHRRCFFAMACFTGPMTMGFSRTFTRHPEQSFAAYRFPGTLLCQGIVNAWIASCPSTADGRHDQSLHAPLRHQTNLRVHSNEVCRALINAHPETILFADSPSNARERYSLLIELADWQKIPQQFDAVELQSLDARVACRLRPTK